MKSYRILILGTLLIALAFTGRCQQLLSLQQCREMALQHNQKLQIAKENTEAATALRKAAFTQFFPDFGFTGSYAHSTKKLGLLSENQYLPVIPYTAITSEGELDPSKLGPNDIVINPVTQQPVLDKNGNPVFQKYAYMPKDGFSIDLTNVFLLNFGLTQPIFTGGKIFNAYKSAKFMEQIAWSNQALEASEVIYKVDEDYWRVISVQEKVKLAIEYQQMIKKLIYDLENYEKEGIIINNDLLKAKVKENEAELNLLKANNGLVLSMMALCQVIGLPLDANIKLADSIQDIEKSSISSDPAQAALTNRPEIAILRNNVNLANAGVNIMKSRFLPDIGLTANYGWMNPTPYNGFKKEFEGDFNLGLVCKVPLWHWGERMHTLNVAKHQMKASELKLDETVELISLQVRQAQYQYIESIKKTELTSRSLGQAYENLKVTNDKFSEGMLKAGDVLEAQTMWQKAYAENIDARTETKINNTYLLKVSGELQKENK